MRSLITKTDGFTLVFRLANRVAVAVVLCATSAFSGAQAQQNTEAGALEEVIVTAIRRESAIQDTPMAISALTAQQLRDSGAVDIRDIDLITPGLWIGGNAGFGQQGVQIRGIGSVLTGIGGDEGVGTYIDGIYQGRSTGFVFQFADIERIEVLRGPQGTLYGRNATGGAINIITKTPGDELTGNLELTATNFDGIGLSGYVLAPIVEGKLSVKFAGATYERDGYAYSPTLDKKLNAEDDRYFSTALHWTPAADTDVVLRGYFGETNSPAVFKAILDGQPQDIIPIEFDSFDERQFNSLSATIRQNFASFSVTAILGYLGTEVNTQVDSDGGATDNVRFTDEESSDQYTAEIQLTSRGDGRFNWLAGVNYFDEEATVRTPFNILRTLPQLGGPIGIFFAGDIATQAISAFADFSYKLTDRATLTAGARYNDEEKDWRGCIAFFTLLETDFSPTLCDGAFTPDSHSENSTTPHVILDYAMSDDTMVYASATKGFRSGGWNWTEPTIPSGPNRTGFGPEEVWSYEIGAKMDLMDGRARLNVAAYLADYTDLQVRADDPASSLIVIRNAADATVEGAEVEFSASPSEQFHVAATVSWLDATYDSFAFTDNVGVPQDHKGNRLNRAPEWQTSLMAQYSIGIGNWGTVTPRVEWQYTSEVFHNEFNVQPIGSKSFNIVNLRTHFKSADEQWGFTAFIDNVGDERYFEHSFQPILPQDQPALISKPRMYGVKVFYQF